MVGIRGIIENVAAEQHPTNAERDQDPLEKSKGVFQYTEVNESFSLRLSQSHSLKSDAKNVALPYFETEDKQFACGLVGGVYNRKELRDRLISLGYVFQGMEDAELIIYLYKQYGILNLEKLEGSFSLFLLDRKSNKVLLARDPNGTKPLYYAHGINYYCFGSSISQVLNYPKVKAEAQINYKQLGSFLRYGALAVQGDFFQNIKTFPAGHYALIDLYSNQFYIRSFGSSYLQAPLLPENETQNIALQIETLTDGLLKQQVQEIQTGLILDGSAASVCLASIIQKNSSKKLRTYSLKRLPGSLLKPTPTGAEKFADLLKTKHTEIDLSNADALTLLKEWTTFSAQPTPDISGIIQLALAKEIHQETQLIWNSLGADCIYHSHPCQQKMEYLWKLFPKIPRFLLPLAYKWFNLNPSLQLENIAVRNEADLFLALHEVFSEAEMNSLLLPEQHLNTLSASLSPEVGRAKDIVGGLDWHNANHLLNLIQNYLPKKQAESIELPYIQYGMENRNAYILNKLVQPILNSGNAAFKIPGQTFMEAMTEKQLGETHKYPHYTEASFTLLIKWLKNQLTPILDQFLDPDLLKKQGIWNVNAVLQIRKQFYSNPKLIHAQRLWLVLQAQIWICQWVKHPNPFT
ncbi:MAG: hypothetical protein EOO99_08455 [Pedobacter sp.]|nr:MAG: hypothetical protein EOO99_08455 [Pedobacter sp.]